MLTFPVIYMITSLWGLRPGIISICLWTLGLSYFTFEPRFSLHIMSVDEIIHLIIFFSSSVFVSFFIDKKRQKELKQNLEIVHMSAQDLERKARALVLESESYLKDQFVNTLSHDLRNPLSMSMMATQMILKRPDDTNFVTRMCNRSLVSLKRIDMMIQDLLDSRRISAGNELNLKFIEFDFLKLLENLKIDFEYLYGDRFVLKVKNKMIVKWSENYIKRAIENLVGNAVKYGSSSTSIELGYDLFDSDNAIIWVKNQGEVLSDKEIESILTPFTRLKEKDQKQKGWGIGLSLVNAVVAGHGGSVKVTSQEGEGTTFIMTLPLDGSKESSS